MEWWHKGSPHPKKSRVQKSTGKVLTSFFLGLRWHPPHWLPSKGPNYQCRVLLISAGANKKHFEEKSRGKVKKGVLFLHDNAPTHRALATQTKLAYTGLPMSWSPTLFSGPGPLGLPPVPWTEKTIERSPFFVRRGGHSCRGETLFFLNGLQKLEQRAKECIELRGEHVE